uniref:protein-tyrosine-phosphatase n=1 Tax=Sinocyclocheilus anshuiensis TaxID=1608454 RepID=A0A671MQP2_9TELE
MLQCRVNFLDDTYFVNALGQDLFNKVCEHLDLLERDYYGLFMWDSPSTRVWLDCAKEIRKQIKSPETEFFFNIKFYPPDPFILVEDITRYLLCLQLRKDIVIGQLLCPSDILALLGSYTVQSTLGEYDPNLHQNNYVSEIVLAPNQSEELEERIMELHSTYRFMSPAQADMLFLENAMGLPMYGVDLHPAKDVSGADVMLGVCSEGLMVYEDEIKTNIFLWPRVLKISHKRSTFLLKMRPSEEDEFEGAISFSLASYRACKQLWKCCVEHHSFFRYVHVYVLQNQGLTRCSILSIHMTIRNTRGRSSEIYANTVFERITHSKNISIPLYRKLIGEKMLNPVVRSNSVEQLETKSLPSRSPPNTPNCVTADGDLLLVRISPDQDGKFGFNVKGGVDQKMPLAISHVNPASPASHCVPPLMEGDQVLLINGRDISEHTHQQVVMFIKASRESHSKELALLVRRKGMLFVDVHVCKYDLRGINWLNLIIDPSGEMLEESMTRLERGLVTGTLLLHFEKLYRKKEGMSMCCAKQSENMDKNRYKDVLPYDITRVVLQEEGDDYVNASHVKTEPTGCALQYIAAQGPLPHTCTHFWRSVWEQNVSVIVMLTTLTERGRTKCHQYWPHPPEVRDYGYLQVCCHSEECNLAYVTRELTLTNTQSGQQRSITHLQYVAWPDHGVPEDSSDFLDFVQSMRSMREESVPLMVHCSAGIGRTGVLITMETAMTLMEKEKPVYALEIITLMREQRAMLVQTSCQFTFVCEAILRVYRERMKKSSTPNS